MSPSPSQARRRPASCGSPTISGRKGRWVCPIARLAPAGRARPSPPPPEPRACEAAEWRLTRTSTQRPREAEDRARRVRPIVDALNKPNAHSRAALADSVRALAHSARAADRASGQARIGCASTREAAAGGGVDGTRTCQRVEGGGWGPFGAHIKRLRSKSVRGARAHGRAPRVGGFYVSGMELWVWFTSPRAYN